MEFLKFLENMKDLRIVKFFSQFLGEEKLTPLFDDMKQRAADGSFGGLARQLVVWAIILAVGAFLIDQAFYWTRPGQIERARENWEGIKDGAAGLVENVRALVARIRSGAGKHDPKGLPRGRG